MSVEETNVIDISIDRRTGQVFSGLGKSDDELCLSLQQDCNRGIHVSIAGSGSRRRFFSYSTVGWPG